LRRGPFVVATVPIAVREDTEKTFLAWELPRLTAALARERLRVLQQGSAATATAPPTIPDPVPVPARAAEPVLAATQTTPPTIATVKTEAVVPESDFPLWTLVFVVLGLVGFLAVVFVVVRRYRRQRDAVYPWSSARSVF
jgi:hypothetical protein